MSLKAKTILFRSVGFSDWFVGLYILYSKFDPKLF